MPIIPACRRQRQEDSKFEASLGYIARSCHKHTSKQVSKQANNYTFTCMLLNIILPEVISIIRIGHFFPIILVKISIEQR
jgi:hypothetical protein